jgi:hypothetical protein
MRIQVRQQIAVNEGMENTLHAVRPAAFPWIRYAGLLAMGYVALAAADSRSQLVVGATVRPMARIEALAAPASLLVSDADLKRGYVAVPQPMRLRVYSNSRTGFALDVRNLARDMPAMAISGMGQDVEVSGEGGWIVQHWNEPQTVSLELHFRFALPGGLAPGEYPWPVQLQVHPLTGP